MNLLNKQYKFIHEKNIRKNFLSNEIFFYTYFILKQTRYSKKLDYFSFKSRYRNQFKTKIKNCCLLTCKFNAINSKIKLSNIKIARKIDDGSLVGFYRSLW